MSGFGVLQRDHVTEATAEAGRHDPGGTRQQCFQFHPFSVTRGGPERRRHGLVGTPGVIGWPQEKAPTSAGKSERVFSRGRCLSQETSIREEVCQPLDVIWAGKPDLSTFGSMQGRIVPPENPFGSGGTAPRGAHQA